MNIRKFLSRILLLLSIPFWISSCTESPFGENVISGDRSAISGKVMLDTNVVAKNALVWLEGMDITTRTDDEGEFRIEALPRGAQGGSYGYTGTLNLYYYYGNFKLAKTTLALQDGQFIYDSGPINGKGKISEPVIMQKLVDITMQLSPSYLVIGTNPQVRVDVVLTALDDSVSVFYPGNVEGTLHPLTLVDKSNGNHWTVQSTLIGVTSGPATKTIAAGDSQKRSYILGAGFIPDKNAEYEIVPYFLLKHEPIPSGIYQDPEGGSFTSLANHWKLPFEREGGKLSVQASDD